MTVKCATCPKQIDTHNHEGWCLMHEEETRYFCDNNCLAEFTMHLELDLKDTKIRTINEILKATHKKLDEVYVWIGN